MTQVGKGITIDFINTCCKINGITIEGPALKLCGTNTNHCGQKWVIEKNVLPCSLCCPGSVGLGCQKRCMASTLQFTKHSQRSGSGTIGCIVKKTMKSGAESAQFMPQGQSIFMERIYSITSEECELIAGGNINERSRIRWRFQQEVKELLCDLEISGIVFNTKILFDKMAHLLMLCKENHYKLIHL